MKRRRFLSTVMAGAAMSAGSTLAQMRKRPNIILFLTDDQDKPSIGAYGGQVWTPNLDRMAKEGMLFNNAFVSSTVCTPSRYAFLTGRFASRSYSQNFLEECPKGSQAFPAFNVGLEPDNMNLGAVLSTAGYRTGFVGKYHVSGVEALKKPEHFAEHDLTYVASDAKDNAETTEGFRKNELGYRKMLTDRGFDWAKNIYLGNMVKPYSNHNLEWTVDAALEFIEENKDRPFYLHCCTTLVHGPDKSWSNSMDDPLIAGNGRINKPITPEGMTSRKEILAELEKRGLNREEGHAGYSWVDAGVGAILKKLKKLGIDNNTLVIFTADHGSNMKSSLFDVDGCCVPFIMRWPAGIKRGTKCDVLVQSIDIAATAFDLGGAKLPKEYKLDGRSMAPLFKGATPKNWRDHLYIELGFGRAVRSKDWKYIAIRYPKEQVEAIKKARPEKLPTLMAPLNRAGIGTRGAQNANFYYEDALFRVTRDRLEEKNLANDPEFRPQLEKMQAMLMNDLKTFGRPYGEFIPGGNAAEPGQVGEQQELVRQIKIQGKTVILPNGIESDGKGGDSGKKLSKEEKQAARDKRRAEQRKKK